MPSETSSQISNATNGIEPPRGYVSIKASKDGILRQVVPDYEHLHDAYELLWEMPVTMAICNWWVSCRNLSISRSLLTPTTIHHVSRQEKCRCSSSERPAHRLQIRGQNAVLQNTRDGAEDAQDDLVPSIQDDGCESGACKI